MAIKRLLDKFKNKFNWEGRNLRALLVNVFAGGRKTIEDKILQDTFSDWKKQEKVIGKIELPKVDDLLSSNSRLIRIADDKTKEVSRTLKENLLNDLKSAIMENQKEGIFKQGALLNDKTIDSFKGKLNKTFESYIEKDEIKAGKLEQIALTESRNVVNPLKYEYALRVSNNNPDLRVFKEWQHYPWKSKEPRKGHNEKNKERISIEEDFKVNYYKKKKGSFVLAGTDYMRFPHDEFGGARQNISCHCDIRFYIVRKNK